VSSREGSYGTPLGTHEVAKKIGDGQPKGMKFASRRPTGEIVQPNAPGRDPIVSRILWLKGLESSNRNSFRRCIYIHGTTEEWRIGTPASYGCIRMRSNDVVNLYRTIGVGAKVQIVNAPLALPPSEPEVTQPAQPQPPTPAIVRRSEKIIHSDLPAGPNGQQISATGRPARGRQSHSL
jgi:hypothetical protein